MLLPFVQPFFSVWIFLRLSIHISKDFLSMYTLYSTKGYLLHSCMLRYPQMYFIFTGVQGKWSLTSILALLWLLERHFSLVIDHLYFIVNCSCPVLLLLLTSYFFGAGGCTNSSYVKYVSPLLGLFKTCLFLLLAYFWTNYLYFMNVLSIYIFIFFHIPLSQISDLGHVFFYIMALALLANSFIQIWNLF